MQDGTNSHMTKVNDKRLKEIIPNYWEKGGFGLRIPQT